MRTRPGGGTRRFIHAATDAVSELFYPAVPVDNYVPRFTVSNILVFGAIFGSGFLAPTLAIGLVPADLFIFAMILIWATYIPRGEPRHVLQQLAVPLSLIFAGSMVGTMAVGFKPWIITDLIKDFGSFASLLAIVLMLRVGGRSSLVAAGWASALATVLVSSTLIMDVGTRAEATFANPNIAAHFLATNLIVMTRATVPRWLRITTFGFGVGGLIVTGSFGALMMSIGAFGYFVVSLPRARRRVFVKRGAIGAAVVLAVVMIAFGGTVPGLDSDTGFNERHFERSSEGRFGKWTAALDVAIENPLGIGPGSNRGLALLPGDQEAHSEYLAYLSERTLIGFIGLILLYLALWRLGPRGGVTRALVIGFALQSLVRETFHYRHLWLLLGVAIVLEEHLGSDEEVPAGRRESLVIA